MPIVNLNINYENIGNATRQDYTLNLIKMVISKRFNNDLNYDNRFQYGQIYRKLKIALAQNSLNIDLTTPEFQFLKSCFESVNTTLDESIDILLLELKFK